MKLSQLRTIDVIRPGVGRRYTMLPVDHVDVTGFHAFYDGSPLRPSQLDIAEGDQIVWQAEGEHYQALVDEVVVDQRVLRVAFRDARSIEPDQW